MKSTLSEVMTITLPLLVYKTIKGCYLKSEDMLLSAFPSLVSYTRFIELKARIMIPMGFKLQSALNHKGEIKDFYVISANKADNNSTVIKRISTKLFGKVYADKGYLLNYAITELLLKKNIQFITKAKKGMDNVSS